MQAFTDRLARTIEARGLTKAELCRRLEIRPERLNHWFSRGTEPDYELLLRVCFVLSTHPNYLLGVSDLMDPIYADEFSRLRDLESEVRLLRRALNTKKPGQ